MRIKNNISFPYPILGVSDDILPGLPPDSAVLKELDSNGKDYVFQLTLNFENEYLQEKIDSGEAEFVCEADCSNTFFNKCVHSNNRLLEIVIPRKSVKGRVNLYPFIVAKSKIANYDNPNKHEDFDGFAFDIEPGEVLAAFPQLYFDTDLRSDILHVAGTYMEIRKDDNATEVKHRLDTPKIGIILPTALYDIYQSKIGEQNVQIIHASLAFNALLCALYNLDDMRDRDLLWVRCLIARINEDEKFSAYRDQIDKNDVPALAQALLGNPYHRLFNFLETTNSIE